MPPPTPCHNAASASRHPLHAALRTAFGALLTATALLAPALLAPALGGCTSVGPYTQTVHAAAKPVIRKGLPRASNAPTPAAPTPTASVPAAGEPTKLQGYAFSAEPTTMPPPDVEHLRVVLGARASYATFSGEKKCGGFHPDYAVQWSDGERQYLTLICFGCDEFKVFGPNIAERYDMAPGVSEQLEKLLTGHKIKPPAPTSP